MIMSAHSTGKHKKSRLKTVVADHEVFASPGAIPSLREMKPKPLRYVFILPTGREKLRCAVVFCSRADRKTFLFHATVHKKRKGL